MRFAVPSYCLMTLLSLPAAAQEQNPSNLYLAELRYQGARLELGPPRKLTGDRGRNSQPSFTPDSRAIVFNAVREGEGGQGDVYRIDLGSGVETRITRTPENENSPTISSSGELLVIRWKTETLFREWGLWVYGPDGTPRRGILPGPDTVGYFIPLDETHFVLVRPTSRFAVALFDLESRQTVDLEWPVARLPPQRIPGQAAVSFVRTDSSGRHQIRRLDPARRQVSPIAPTVPGRTIHTWARSDLVLMAKGNTVFARSPGTDSAWRPVARFDAPDLQNVSTYVVSPDGRWVILTSTLKPPLQVALTDSLESGQPVETVVARLRGMREAGSLDRYFLSEADLIGAGSARQSTTLLQFVAELFPRSYRAVYALGNAHRAAGDFTQAAGAYRKALELNPRSTPADREAAQTAERALRDVTK